MLVNIPVGHGADFKGVVSDLYVPEKTDGALIDPNSLHDSLIESEITTIHGMIIETRHEMLCLKPRR